MESPDVFTLAVTVPLPEPEVGLTVSHAELSLAVHDRVPLPLLVIFTVFDAGFAAPCVPENERLVGLRPIVGLAATVKVTGMVRGVLVAPVASTVIVALYVPAVRPARLTLAVKEPLPVPEAGLKVNHEALSLVLQASVPVPVFEIDTVCELGLVPP